MKTLNIHIQEGKQPSHKKEKKKQNKEHHNKIAQKQ